MSNSDRITRNNTSFHVPLSTIDRSRKNVSIILFKKQFLSSKNIKYPTVEIIIKSIFE